MFLLPIITEYGAPKLNITISYILNISILETNNLSISNNQAIYKILYMAISIENLLIMLQVITPTDLLQGYVYAIDSGLLEDRKTY